MKVLPDSKTEGSSETGPKKSDSAVAESTNLSPSCANDSEPVESMEAETVSTTVKVVPRQFFMIKYFFMLIGAAHILTMYISMFFNTNVLPVLCWLFINPLSENAYIRILNFIARCTWRQLLDWSELIGGMKLVVTGDMDLLETKYSGNEV